MKIENWGFWTWVGVLIALSTISWGIVRIIAVSKMNGAEITEANPYKVNNGSASSTNNTTQKA